MEQRTIKHTVSCFGIGVHSGKPASLTLHPAEANTGIQFVRTDIKTNNTVKARYDFVSTTTLGTTIKNKSGVEIATIEHLMAALWGCKIDNIIIETDGPEIPIMDGSSEPFIFMIECAGVQNLNSLRKYIEITDEIVIEDKGSKTRITPSQDFSIDMQIEFNDQLIRTQNFKFSDKDRSFKHELSRARTFGFKHEAEMLQKMGLAQGASLDNAIVLHENKVVNQEGLRYKDEFVRHKMLDLIGDLYLAGMPFKGHFDSFKPGHTINNKVLHTLFDTPKSWRIVEDY
ncbi:MAG: UDP-3-O-acyl-N-acetylglucosamine deacetylase [Rickettsiales bacterium]